MDKSNETIVNPFANNQQPFLTDLTKEQDFKVRLVKGKIKVKRKPTWDEQRNYSLQAAAILDKGKSHHVKQAERIRKCAERLEMGFVEDSNYNPVLKLKRAEFCRVRNCPVCQWRRSKMWTSRFFDALPRILEAFPDMRFIMLTLTVANCPISELRSTAKHMSDSWHRFIKQKKFPALGFVRSLEVTTEKNKYDKSGKKLIRAARPNYAHPHYHVLMAVPSSYFNNNYISKDGYAEMWQKALKADYKPVCDVRIVKAKDLSKESTNDTVDEKREALQSALVEVVKYTVKPSDMVQNADWFLELCTQLHKTRAVSLGGIFKDYLSVDDTGALVTKGELAGNEGGLYFNFLHDVKRYRYTGSKNQFKTASELKPANISESDVPF